MEQLQPNIMKKCTVCSAPASGIHLGVHACDSCTSFFRRYHIRKEGTIPPCLFGGLCPITGIAFNTRNYCRACRLAKCLTVGMAETMAWRARADRQANHHPTLPAPLQISRKGRLAGNKASSGTVSGATSKSSSVSSGSRDPSELSPPPSPASTSSVPAGVAPLGVPQYAYIGPLYTPGQYTLPPGSTAIFVSQGNQRVELPKLVTGQGQVLSLSSGSPVVSGYPALSNALWGPRKSPVPAAHLSEPECQASSAKVKYGICQEQPLDLSMKQKFASDGQKAKIEERPAPESRGGAGAAPEEGMRHTSHRLPHAAKKNSE